MVLSMRAAAATLWAKVGVRASGMMQLAALCGAACNVYEPTMIGHGRGHASGVGGDLSSAASGGVNQGSDSGVAETGGVHSGDGGESGDSETRGGSDSMTSAGRSGVDGGREGRAGAANSGNHGGTGVSDAGTGGMTSDITGGITGYGGRVATGGASTSTTGGTLASGGASGAGGASSAGAATTGGKGSSSTSTGGSSGSGNSVGGTMTTGGTATGGSAGKPGSAEVCSGCARLYVPLSSSTDRARFVLSIAPGTDLTDATITLRIARPKGSGGKFRAYVQEGGPDYHVRFSPSVSLGSLSSSMSSITFKVDDSVTTADITAIARIGVEISGEGGSSFSNPTLIYVDRISVVGEWVADQDFTFDTAAAVSTTPTTNGPLGKMWLNNYKADTNLAGAAIEWLGH